MFTGSGLVNESLIYEVLLGGTSFELFIMIMMNEVIIQYSEQCTASPNCSSTCINAKLIF